MDEVSWASKNNPHATVRGVWPRVRLYWERHLLVRRFCEAEGVK